jgi:taurine dioxygenase
MPDTLGSGLTDFGLGLHWEASQGPSPLTEADLPALLHRHGLLLIRGATLDDGALVEIARAFGSPNIALPAPFQSPSTPFVRIQSNVPGVGDQDAGFYWHTDGAWSDPPTAVTVLYCQEAPQAGGETLFVDMRAVFDALGPELQERVAGLRGRYACREVYAEDLRAQGLSDPVKLAELADLEHPLVRIHPAGGRRALCLHGRLLKSVIGLASESSDALLSQLWAVTTNGRYQYRHTWSDHDLVIWDNSSVIHRALSSGPGARKITRRVTV